MPRLHVSNQQLASAVQEIFTELASGKRKFTAEDLAAGLRRVRRSFLAELDSNDGLAWSLGYSELIWGDSQVKLKAFAEFEKISLLDLQKIVAEYLHVNNRTFAYLEKSTK